LETYLTVNSFQVSGFNSLECGIWSLECGGLGLVFSYQILIVWSLECGGLSLVSKKTAGRASSLFI